MTGYGKSIVTYNEKKINVEIKSLNSKALDLSARIAPLYREKEMEMRQMIAAALIRGKVDFAIWIEKDEIADATPINAALVENYYHQLREIQNRVGIPEPQDWFQILLRMPDVTTTNEVEILTDEEWETARQAIEQALNALVEFRKQEGIALQKKFIEKTISRRYSPASSLMRSHVSKRFVRVSSKGSTQFPKSTMTRIVWSKN